MARRFEVDLEELAHADADVDALTHALEAGGSEGAASPALWTEQFAASGKQGKNPN